MSLKLFLRLLAAKVKHLPYLDCRRNLWFLLYVLLVLSSSSVTFSWGQRRRDQLHSPPLEPEKSRKQEHEKSLLGPLSIPKDPGIKSTKYGCQKRGSCWHSRTRGQVVRNQAFQAGKRWPTSRAPVAKIHLGRADFRRFTVTFDNVASICWVSPLVTDYALCISCF